jgi:hypothetical protein
MRKSSAVGFGLLALIIIVPTILLAYAVLQPTETARGKSPARPISQELDPAQQLAQDLALSDSQVQAYTVGRRAEVINIIPTGNHYPASAAACGQSPCQVVEIYVFDNNATVQAFIDVESREVIELFYQPGVHAGINGRLARLAQEIATNSPEVIAALGYRPGTEDLAAVEADAPGTACDGSHLCVAPTFRVGSRVLWALVDLTVEELVGVYWTGEAGDETGISEPFLAGGCPSPGTVEQLGWVVNHELTNSDGLRLYDVTYNGAAVLTSAKLVEWHVDYGSNGFRDIIGCGTNPVGGSYRIYPFGDTTVLQILDESAEVIGFEVVQDFRMGEWGQTCNYRYEQHFQFYADGSFRVVGGAFGRGCGTVSTYRPVVRIDLAANGSGKSVFGRWVGDEWEIAATEEWWLQEPPYTAEGFKYVAVDDSGQGYLLEPGRGQFGDAGRGDDAFLYATLRHPSEGDADLGTIGACCNNNQLQGPHNYVNMEPIMGADIVLWYVPQMETDHRSSDGNPPYCWTVRGEPNPETYPCFTGPMFAPLSATALFTQAVFSHHAQVDAGQPLGLSNFSAAGLPNVEYLWDFGNGVTSTERAPGYTYPTAGQYTISLVVTSSLGTASASSQVEVLPGLSYLYLPSLFRPD